MERAATISESGLYRYSLTRRWGPNKLFVLWIMLNPSTADDKIDDPTIRRCISFTRGWGYDALEVVNLFALRSPNPQDLRDCMEAGMDPIGRENDRMIDFAAGRAARVIAAWGAHTMAEDRCWDVNNLPGMSPIVECLGRTKNGNPRHPLYVKSDTKLEVYSTHPAPGGAGEK